MILVVLNMSLLISFYHQSAPVVIVMAPFSDPYAHVSFPEQDLSYKPPEPYEPEPYKPEPYKPEPYEPEPYKPEPYVPEPYVPEPYVPEPYKPEPEPYHPPSNTYHEPEPYQPAYDEPSKLDSI